MRILLLTIAVLIPYANGYCCDCNGSIGMKDAKSVFEGKVVGIEQVETPYVYCKIKFRISKVIKGLIGTDTVIVNTPCLDIACCGIPFSINQQYLVYAIIKNDRLYTNACTETKKIELGQ